MGKGKYPWVRTALLYGAAAVLSLFSACKESGETENTGSASCGRKPGRARLYRFGRLPLEQGTATLHPSFRRRRPAAPGGGSAGQFGCSGRDGDLQRRFAPSRGASPRRGNIPCSGPENAAFGRICLEHRRRRYIQYPSGPSKGNGPFPGAGKSFSVRSDSGKLPSCGGGQAKGRGRCPGLLALPRLTRKTVTLRRSPRTAGKPLRG